MAEDLHGFADFARSLAAAARLETLPGCRDRWDRAENKLPEGFDPVTESDRNSEAAIRRLIEARFPEHGIIGEEFPERPGTGRWSWSIDPIDGTRAYVCGLPSWTTLIALLDEGEPVLGIVDAPRLDELYLGHDREALVFAAAGETRPLATSGCRSASEARLSTTDPDLFAGAEAEGFERLRRAARLTRYGLDAYGYALVAAGSLDIVAESGLKPHDYNALVPLVRAAGGSVSNWSGGTDLAAGQIVAAASEALLEEACRLLGGS
jgi:myo-inositol-1(or 4)-monophosphatase